MGETLLMLGIVSLAAALVAGMWLAREAAITREAAVELMLDGEWWTGRQLVAADPRVRRGTVYVVLGELEERGIVESRQLDDPLGEAFGDSIPRREYRVVRRNPWAIDRGHVFKRLLRGSVS